MRSCPAAACTCGWSRTVVASTSARSRESCSPMAESAASAEASSSRACASSSAETAPVATSPLRRATSARAFCTATWRALDVRPAGVDRAVQTADLAHRAGEVCHCLLVGHARVVRVEPHEHLSGGDLHAVVRADAHDGTRRLRRDADDVALDVRVVGALRATGRPGSSTAPTQIPAMSTTATRISRARLRLLVGCGAWVATLGLSSVVMGWRPWRGR